MASSKQPLSIFLHDHLAGGSLRSRPPRKHAGELSGSGARAFAAILSAEIVVDKEVLHSLARQLGPSLEFRRCGSMEKRHYGAGSRQSWIVTTDLRGSISEELLKRAEEQEQAVEKFRLAAVRRAFTGSVGTEEADIES